MSVLRIDTLSVKLGNRDVVQNVTASVRLGECVGLIGPNGSGKTSLMRGALGLTSITGASDIAALPPLDRARRAAWLPQTREVAWPVTARTLVALGRHPHPRGATSDRMAVDEALARMGLGAFADRDVTKLSGGEQARVLIARALAQETPLIVADEPTAGLDPAGQIETMDMFAGLAHEGRAVLVSLHDLGQAMRYCTRLLLMDGGRLIADGTPRNVLSPENLRDVFGVRAHIADTADGPVLIPVSTT